MGIHPLDAAIRWTEGRRWMIDNITIQDLNKFEVRLNPNQMRGGANMPHKILKAYSSGTKSLIDLKPGCKIEFVSCL